jgi:fructokinase
MKPTDEWPARYTEKQNPPYDVAAMGELLVDFTENGRSDRDNPYFEANPGGGPPNLLAMLAKLGKKTVFIGKVGDDICGTMLRRAVIRAGISDEGLVVDGTANTTLAFVSNAPDGERSFSFFRNPGADTMLCADEIDARLVSNCRIFHFGSLSLTDEPVKSAARYAVALARHSGALISFDPNLRPSLWRSPDDARAQIRYGLGQCDVLKIADDELRFLYGSDDISDGISRLRAEYGNIRMLFVTKGKYGAECYYKDIHAESPAFTEVRTVDTTGAGDTFCGVCLSYLLDHDPAQIGEKEIYEMLRFANAAASLVTAKKGALRSMPDREEIGALLRTGTEAGGKFLKPVHIIEK